jgi:hypothetical protein
MKTLQMPMKESPYLTSRTRRKKETLSSLGADQMGWNADVVQSCGDSVLKPMG